MLALFQCYGYNAKSIAPYAFYVCSESIGTCGEIGETERSAVPGTRAGGKDCNDYGVLSRQRIGD